MSFPNMKKVMKYFPSRIVALIYETLPTDQGYEYKEILESVLTDHNILNCDLVQAGVICQAIFLDLDVQRYRLTNVLFENLCREKFRPLCNVDKNGSTG